jgi:hypothetical protein
MSEAKKTTFEITPTVHGAGPAQGRLYEDDGETYACEAGASARIGLEWTPGKGLSVSRNRALPFSRYRFTDIRMAGESGR